MTTILAIDPGALGGYAVSHRLEAIYANPMPKTEGDLLSAITLINRVSVMDQTERIAYVEEVGGFCGVGQPGSAMFKFGRGFGFILGILMATGWRIVLVRPQRWQKEFSLGTKFQAGGASPWKNKLKAKAQQLYPTVDVTLKTADALLILDYAIHQEG